MSWYFNDFAKLKSINPRQEGSGDDAEPAGATSKAAATRPRTCPWTPTT
jgi:hypothetical protein